MNILKQIYMKNIYQAIKTHMKIYINNSGNNVEYTLQFIKTSQPEIKKYARKYDFNNEKRKQIPIFIIPNNF